MTPPVATGSNSATTGLIIPLYSYPGESWTPLVHLKRTHPSVPIMVIINPWNGPGVKLDANYVAGIEKLQAAEIIVLGYDHTIYGTRASSTVQGDIDRYHEWYPTIDGIFFDEMANAGGSESYYATLSAYARSLGFAYTMGNPGTSAPSSYVGTVNCVVIYESPGTPSISTLSTLTGGMDRQNFVLMAYAVNDLSSEYAASASAYVGYLYITDKGEGGSNPYSSLPSYLSALVAALDKTSSSSQTAASSALPRSSQ
jgi:hypothetical protein